MLEIPGLDGTSVLTVSPIVVRIKPGSAPEIANFTLTLAGGEGSRASWKEWFARFTQGGGDADEKNGSLTLLYRLEVLMTFDLKGLGVVRMTTRGEVELYCEGMRLRMPGDGPVVKPPAGPGTSAAPPPVPTDKKLDATAPEGTSSDQGARDPEGVPRAPDSVRLSYSSSRTQVQSEEKAEYRTKTSPERAESHVAAKMKELGWKEASREETGAAKEGTWRIDVRWERDKQVARLTIGRSKDGSTTLYWQVTTKGATK